MPRLPGSPLKGGIVLIGRRIEEIDLATEGLFQRAEHIPLPHPRYIAPNY